MDNFQVQLGNLIEAPAVALATAKQAGQCRNGSSGEDIGDQDVGGVQPGADAGDGLGGQHRIAAKREEVIVDTDALQAEQIAHDRSKR